MKPLLCRIMWCQKCHDSYRPQQGDYYVLYRGTHKDFVADKVRHFIAYPMRGFVPHTIQEVSRTATTVTFLKRCNVCGITIVNHPNGGSVKISFGSSTADSMPIKEWVALTTKWTHTGYELK